MTLRRFSESARYRLGVGITLAVALWLALLGAPAAASPTVSDTIAVGDSPYSVDITGDGKTAYVSNSGGGSVSVIDVATSSVIATWAIGGTPAGLVLSRDETRLYVASLPENRVSVVDTADGSVVSFILLPGGPMKLALSPDGSRIYASLPVPNLVSVIDPATDTLVNTYSVGMLPYGLMPSHDGAVLYVSDMFGVKAVNAATGASLATISVGSFPANFALTADGVTLYVANYASSTVSVIATATNTVVGTIPAAGGPWAVALSPDGSSLFATARDADQLVQVDVATAAVTTQVPVGSEPFDVAVTPDGTRALVVNAKGDTVSVVGLRPTPPRQVQVVPGDTEVQVDWQVPQYTAGAPIQIYTATAQPGGRTCTAAVTRCTISGLDNGIPYTITVTAANPVGVSGSSDPSQPVTPLPKPGPPRDVTGTPGDSQVLLNWREPAANGGPAVTGYTATASPGGATCTTAGTTCTVSGLANGTAYTFTVVATNAIGDGPPSAASPAVIPVGRPQPPSGVSVQPARRSATVQWVAPEVTGGAPITGYTATVLPGGATCTTAATTCAINGLLPGTSYAVTVVASNGVVISDPSAPVAFSTDRIPRKVQRPVSAAGRPPQRIVLSGITVLTGPNALTNAGQRIRTQVRATPTGSAAQGQVRYFTIIRGKAGKVSIRTYGYPRLKVVLVQRAPGTETYLPYLRRTVYRGGVPRG